MSSYTIQKTDRNGLWREVEVIDEEYEEAHGRGLSTFDYHLPLGFSPAVDRVRTMLPFEFMDWRGKSFKDYREFLVLMRERAESRARHFAETDCADFGGGDCGYIKSFVDEWERLIDLATDACDKRISQGYKEIEDDESVCETGWLMFRFGKFWKSDAGAAFAETL